jgi:non-specific serine/threonine protein kinase/serine/threonine-protein kinase
METSGQTQTIRIEKPELTRLEGVFMAHQGTGEHPGGFVGRYKLLELLGEGGFGVVWRAEQSEPVHREVAVKMIKLGMNSREVLARFEQERHVLASMEHPHIAGMLDAGITPDGRPYFVMELVRGVPLTDYCQDKNLPLRERVLLFCEVCRGVQHAHQKGVIHRDLKPSNILVTEVDGQPVPKIIDFGIAKAMAAREAASISLMTQADVAIGTPLYMSPEQLSDTADVDTRSDIYALGAIFYEVLTGTPPIQAKTLKKGGLEAMRRIMAEVQPPRPSRRILEETRTLKKSATAPQTSLMLASLPADLDWITLCAIEKDPARRYAGAAEFAADLQRFLDSRPVAAHPPAVTYVAGRWIRRHRTAFAAAVVSVLAMITGTALALWQASEARREKKHAEEQAVRAIKAEIAAKEESARAQQTAKFLTQLLDSAAEGVKSGLNPEALKLALDQSRTLLADIKDDPVLQTDLLGRLAGLYATAGEWKSSLELMREHATAIARMHGDLSDEAITAELSYLKRVGDHGVRASAPPQLEVLRGRIERGGQRGGKLWFDVQRELCRVSLKLDDGAMSLAYSTVAMEEALRQKLTGKPLLNIQLAHAASLESVGRTGDALKLLEESRATAAKSSSSRDRLDLVNKQLIVLLRNLGDYVGAAKIQRDKLAYVRSLPETKAAGIITELLLLSTYESSADELEPAFAHAQEALALARDGAGSKQNKYASSRVDTGKCLIRLAECESDLRRHGEAIGHALEARDNALEQGSKTALFPALVCLARMHKLAGHHDEAYQIFDECRTLRDKDSPNYRNTLYDTEEMINIRLVQGRPVDAIELSREMWRRMQSDPVGRTDTGGLGYVAGLALKSWEALKQSRPGSPAPAELQTWTTAKEREGGAMQQPDHLKESRGK